MVCSVQKKVLVLVQFSKYGMMELFDLAVSKFKMLFSLLSAHGALKLHDLIND